MNPFRIATWQGARLLSTSSLFLETHPMLLDNACNCFFGGTKTSDWAHHQFVLSSSKPYRHHENVLFAKRLEIFDQAHGCSHNPQVEVHLHIPTGQDDISHSQNLEPAIRRVILIHDNLGTPAYGKACSIFDILDGVTQRTIEKLFAQSQIMRSGSKSRSNERNTAVLCIEPISQKSFRCPRIAD